MKFRFQNKGITVKYNYLIVKFEKTYKDYCKNHYHDDRRLFINMYRMTIRMLLTADKVYNKSVLLDCAMAEQLNKQIEELTEIQARFN